MPTQARQGILGTNHRGQEAAMETVAPLAVKIMVHQVRVTRMIIFTSPNAKLAVAENF